MKGRIGFILLAFIGIFPSTISSAQRTGPQAEMERLERQAEDLASQNDSEGASLAIGKAAMMADILLKETEEPRMEVIYQAASSLYRGQELGLRALALYEQTGGHPPAPVGVCHYLIEGKRKLATSKELLQQLPASVSAEKKNRRENLMVKNHEWADIFSSLQNEFECQAIQSEN